MYSTLYSVCTLSQKHKNTEYSDEIMHRMGGVLIMQFETRSVHKVKLFNKKNLRSSMPSRICILEAYIMKLIRYVKKSNASLLQVTNCTPQSSFSTLIDTSVLISQGLG